YGPPPYGPPGQAYGYPPAGYQVPRYVPPPVAVPTSPGGYPLAEFTDRLVARLIDGAILGAVSLIFVVPIYLVVFLSVMPTTTVVNGDPDLALTRGHAFKRYLVERGAALVPAMTWVDGLWQLWDKPYQQCLHDKFA